MLEGASNRSGQVSGRDFPETGVNRIGIGLGRIRQAARPGLVRLGSSLFQTETLILLPTEYSKEFLTVTQNKRTHIPQHDRRLRHVPRSFLPSFPPSSY